MSKKTIPVCTGFRLNDVGYMTLERAIESLQEQYDLIPEEYRKSASFYDEGYDNTDFYVRYDRLETDVEYNARKTIEKSTAKRKLDLERETYEKLKLKFEK